MSNENGQMTQELQAIRIKVVNAQVALSQEGREPDAVMAFGFLEAALIQLNALIQSLPKPTPDGH